MKITIIRPFKSPNDHTKANKKYAAIVDGNADGLVMHWKQRGLWFVGKIENHALKYEEITGPKAFVKWQFLGKPYYERVGDNRPLYITGTVMYAATHNGVRQAFEEPFAIWHREDIIFERNACSKKYREEIQKEAIRLANMTEVVIFKKTLLPKVKRSWHKEDDTARIFVPTDFLESWFEKNISGGWKAWWYRYTPEHTRTLADDMKAAGIGIEEV